MEHSPVIDPRLDAATQNLTHTYFALGRSTEGAHMEEQRAFDICAGPFAHAISNFAVVRELDAHVAQSLRQIANSRPSFAVYLLPGANTESEQSLLQHYDFTVTHELHMMLSETVMPDRVDLEEATGLGERRKVAEFMVEQFFHRQSPIFRRGIAEATSNSTDLNLYRALWNERQVGAVMLCEHAGLIGLYNLCVEPQFRSRGWGSAIVRTIVDQAQERRLSVTLQCEPSLASWYSSLGFKEVGSVSVYGLYRFQEIDIMG